MSRITVIGAGYVGLVTGAGLAALGHDVFILENDRRRLDRLLEGVLPIYEPGLAETIAEARAGGRLAFGHDYATAIPTSDVVFIAVHTPPAADGQADLRFVMAAMASVLEHAQPGLTVVTKSTVPAGTGDRLEGLVADAGITGIEVVSNPEFLREGSAMEDFFHPDRIVVGAGSPEAATVVAHLYERTEAPVFVTSRRSAELAKYAANALLATRISFINEIASISEAVGADVQEVSRIVGADTRIGPRFLQAGLGWGGSCFPKDLSALAAAAEGAGRETTILDAVIEVNARQRMRAVEVLLEAGPATIQSVAVLGLAFKPHTDDLRGSPALDIIGRLLEQGVHVRAHDPQAMEAARRHLANVEYVHDPYAAATGADAVLLATEWPEYLQLDWVRIRTLMRGRLVLDGRNVLHGDRLTELGFEFRSFGRAHPDRSASTGTRRAPMPVPSRAAQRGRRMSPASSSAANRP
jgi:UDPglucose 6-dehydrogenase